MIRAIVEQHAEEAAFQWIMRRSLVDAPHAGLADLARLDRRLEANLDGLQVAGEGGLELAMSALPGDEGEVFSAAVLACRHDPASTALAEIVATSVGDDLVGGLAGALSWVEPSDFEGWASSSPLTAARHARLVAAVAHGRDPGPALDAGLLDDDPRLRAAALRGLGAVGRRDRRDALHASAIDDDVGCRFWAGWSLALAGDPAGAVVLREIARGWSAHAEEAAAYAAISLAHDEASALIRELAARPDARRAAVRAAAALGDPAHLPMLLGWLDEPPLARVAGHAVTTVTGVAVDGDRMADAPEGYHSGPSDDPSDDDVTPDPDDDLAWPAVDAVVAAVRGQRLTGARRFVHGQPLAAASLERALVVGRQPERARAAFELARMRGDRPFDVAAPFRRQRRALAARGAS